jgi:hypothetical protein
MPEQIKGEFVNISTSLYAKHTEVEKITHFAIILKIYSRIASYKSNFSLSNEVTELVPLAITDTLLSLESAEEKLYFILGLLQNYYVELISKDGCHKVVVRNIDSLEKFNCNQIFEALIIVFNLKRGNDFCLKAMLPAIQTNFKDYESLMEQYLELDCDQFEKSVLKLGFCKRKDD